MNKRAFIFIIFLLWFLVGGCELESVNYPTEPSIEFKGIDVYDTLDLLQNKIRLVKIHFYLIDGDGDIGPFDSVNYQGMQGNCHVQLYYKDSNEYKLDNLIDSIGTGWVTMPQVNNLGQDKSLKADVYIDFEYNAEPEKSFKEFFYSIQVFDLALHQSNTIYTDTIITDK